MSKAKYFCLSTLVKMGQQRFFNLRCLFLWAFAVATKKKFPEKKTLSIEKSLAMDKLAMWADCYDVALVHKF